MYKIWLIMDPRRTLVAVLVFTFGMVMVNHFVQLSTHRYGSWLNAGSTPAAQQAPLPAPAK